MVLPSAKMHLSQIAFWDDILSPLGIHVDACQSRKDNEM